MQSTVRRQLAAIVLCGCSIQAGASTVHLVPTTATTGIVGDVVILDVVIDFSDEPNGTIGGNFSITYNPSALAVDFIHAYNVTGGVPFAVGPLTVVDGLLDNWINVGNPFGLSQDGPVTVATIGFEILAGLPPGTSTTVDISKTRGPFGGWISGVDYVSQLFPEYNHVDIARVPLPSALLGMASALCAALAIGRRRTQPG